MNQSGVKEVQPMLVGQISEQIIEGGKDDMSNENKIFNDTGKVSSTKTRISAISGT